MSNINQWTFWGYSKDGLSTPLGSQDLVKCTHALQTHCYMHYLLYPFIDFDFKSLGDKDNKWVDDYHTIKGGLSSPLYFMFPKLDTTYLKFMKGRQRIHHVLTGLLDNINEIIEEKRKLVREKKNNNVVDHEKDLLTLMIESEAMGAGQGLTNEELKVQDHTRVYIV